uniref:zinc finger MYM-type protein 1-like n=1 Tax=Fragaria vesca subsp. vesca TaxID=101020 RepID=UPI0005CA546A|nr:PREDICTED: zinc finger MYM-type protein 1-like [Fragaria vesca subsp. vesca]
MLSNNIHVGVEINLADLHSDPRLRKSISDYDSNIRDQVQIEYLQRGPCQPKDHKCLKTQCGAKERSIEKDAAFCLCCYLFKTNSGEQAGGGVFTKNGYRNWKKKRRLYTHVGDLNNAHNQALKKCEYLMNERQHIRNNIQKNAKPSRTSYRIRLTASVDCIQLLLRQGLAFRGHDESNNSSNQGNFLGLLQFLADHDEQVRVVTLHNAPENLKMTSLMIQKDIVNAAAVETINVIIADMDNALFSILVNEARDVSEAIDALLCKHGLSTSSLRGQGFDGASNMSGELNGLKTLILKENPSAFYVHCFAHQLQLALVAVAKKYDIVGAFFTLVAKVVNIVGASSKRRDILREKQALKVIQALKGGELSSGRGLNQEIEIKRSADTCWSSHYGTLINFTAMFSSIIDVLDEIAFDKVGSDQKHDAFISLRLLQSFDYIFSLHLMRIVLGITHELSQALQRDDQDIVNAMDLVKLCKRKLQDMRDNG